VSAADKRKKGTGEQQEWRMTDIQPGSAACIPPWVADCFRRSHAGQPNSDGQAHDSVNNSSSSSIGADSLEQPRPEEVNTSEVHAALHGNTAPVPANQLAQGLSGFARQLYPTDEESERLHAVTKAVCRVVMQVSRAESWQVAQVLPVGSFVKKTSLTNA
jgi:hypothetical protein